MEKKVEKKYKMDIREAARFIAQTDCSLDEFAEKNNALSADEAKELFNAANNLIDCRKYLDDIRSQTKICVDTFRYGYIGKTVSDVNGSEYTQTRRGKPYGYLAAIQDGDKLYVGYTLLSDAEKYPHPVIGQAIALRNAYTNKEEGLTFEKVLKRENQGVGRNPYLNGESASMLKHFYDRARRYFFPNKFSFSRGTEPIQDPKFTGIHLQQFAQAVINATDQDEFEWALARLAQMIKQANPHLLVDEVIKIKA